MQRRLDVDKKIVGLRDRGMKFRDIGGQIGISTTQTHRIYERIRMKEEGRSRGMLYGLGLGTRAANVLARVQNIRTLIDLQRFIEENPETSGRSRSWKQVLLHTRGCWRKTLREIEDFARANGIRV